MAKYLDDTGLAYFWDKIKTAFASASHSHGNLTNTGVVSGSAGISNGDKLAILDNAHGDVLANSNLAFDGSTTKQHLSKKGTWEYTAIPYLTCSTAAGTAAKTTTLVTGSFTSSDLVSGAQVIVKFTNANSVASPTLSVNGTTAKALRRYGTTAPSTSAASSWNAGSCVLLVYDGSYWYIANYLNSTYSEISAANITNETGSTTGLVTGRRAKAAVDAFAPSATTTTPIMDGTAAVGSETTWAKGDHVHPSDTSKQDTLVSGTNIKTINNSSLLGSGNISVPTNVINGTGTASIELNTLDSASGDYATALGFGTIASGENSLANGQYTTAQRKSQVAIGEYNVLDTTGADGTVKGDYALIVGNGTNTSNRSNALTVDWSGNLNVLGSIFTGMADEFAKGTGTNHIIIAGFHVCFGAEVITLASANTYQETEVLLPYTYTSPPICFASFQNRAGRARTAYCTAKGDGNNPVTYTGVYVGCYGTTASQNYNVNWLTIGV